MNTDHKLDTGTARNLNSLLENNATRNIGESTKETTPMHDYLDRLGNDHVEAGLNRIADEIFAAAAEIRRLENRVNTLQTATDVADQQRGNLADSLLSVMDIELQQKIEEIVKDKISDALDDYDPTDHIDFDDAVDRRIADSSIEDIVRDLLDNASVSISI